MQVQVSDVRMRVLGQAVIVSKTRMRSGTARAIKLSGVRMQVSGPYPVDVGLNQQYLPFETAELHGVVVGGPDAPSWTVTQETGPDVTPFWVGSGADRTYRVPGVLVQTDVRFRVTANWGAGLTTTDTVTHTWLPHAGIFTEGGGAELIYAP